MRFFITIGICMTLYGVIMHAPHWVLALNVLTTMFLIRTYIVTKNHDQINS